MLYLGDSSIKLVEFESNSVDLIITSPPYDNLRTYEALSFEKFKMIAGELFRVLKLGGVVVWVVGDSVVKGSESGSSFKQALYFKEIGFNLHDTMIYEKNTSSFPARTKGNRYTQIFEYMFIFSKGAPKTINLICDKPNKWAGWVNWGKNTHRGKGGTLVPSKDIEPVPSFSPRNNIFKYNVGCGYGTKDKDTYKHPASFPEDLVIDNLLTWSNSNDIVLDPFMGSGTVGTLCVKYNRVFHGIEISKEYFELATTRMEKATPLLDTTKDKWETTLKKKNEERVFKDFVKLISTFSMDEQTMLHYIKDVLSDKQKNPSVLK